MAFTPKFKALFAAAVAAQAMAILQRDFPAAIAGITPPPGRTYPTFQSYKKDLIGAAMNTPSIIVAVRETLFAGDDDLQTRPQVHRLLLRLEIEDQDPEFAAQAAYDYLRAVDQVITSAPIGDWLAALPITHATLPAAANTASLAALGARVGDVRVEAHDYGVLWQAPAGFGMRPAMTVLIETEEV